MSYYTDLQGNKILEFSVPTGKLKEILDDLNFPGVNEVPDAPFETKRIVILIAFREFLKGHLLLEEFSEVASILKMLFPLQSKTEEQDEYESMIYEAADLSLYIRRFDGSNENMVGGFMNIVRDYYSKYKYLLNDLSEKYSTHAPVEK